MALVFGQAAFATTVYSDVVGSSVSFTGIQETSTFGDPEPLFGAPTGVGNQLLFFPSNFSASSAGDGINPGPVDQTGSQLQLTISGNSPTDTIDTLLITEYGDTSLTGTGTSSTGTSLQMSGQLTVLADTTGAIAPVVIPWSGTFTPSASGLFDLVTNPGTTLWSGSVSIDVASYLAPGQHATVAQLSYDNALYAFSEANSSATIQKKVVSGPAVTIQVVPEPATGLLLAGGLIALGLRARRRDV